MRRHEIHQFQRVVRVGHGPLELPQRQAADSPVIILNELAVDLKTLFVGQQLRHVLRVAQLAGDVFQVGVLAARPLAVGPARELHLQEAQFDPHLQHFAAAGSADDPRTDHARLIGPVAKDGVNILILGHESRLFMTISDDAIRPIITAGGQNGYCPSPAERAVKCTELRRTVGWAERSESRHGIRGGTRCARPTLHGKLTGLAPNQSSPRIRRPCFAAD